MLRGWEPEHPSIVLLFVLLFDHFIITTSHFQLLAAVITAAIVYTS
jgi:hypothetical protein